MCSAAIFKLSMWAVRFSTKCFQFYSASSCTNMCRYTLLGVGKGWGLKFHNGERAPACVPRILQYLEVANENHLSTDTSQHTTHWIFAWNTASEITLSRFFQGGGPSIVVCWFYGYGNAVCFIFTRVSCSHI